MQSYFSRMAGSINSQRRLAELAIYLKYLFEENVNKPTFGKKCSIKNIFLESIDVVKVYIKILSNFNIKHEYQYQCRYKMTISYGGLFQILVSNWGFYIVVLALF